MNETVFGSPEIMEIVCPGDVQVVIDASGRRVWINVDGVCRFRAGQVAQVRIQDDRKEEEH